MVISPAVHSTVSIAGYAINQGSKFLTSVRRRLQATTRMRRPSCPRGRVEIGEGPRDGAHRGREGRRVGRAAAGAQLSYIMICLRFFRGLSSNTLRLRFFCLINVPICYVIFYSYFIASIVSHLPRTATFLMPSLQLLTHQTLILKLEF